MYAQHLWLIDSSDAKSRIQQNPGRRGILYTEGFPHSSVGKDSACNAGDLGLILGLGRSPREGNPLVGYACCKESDMTEHACTWAKNLPAMWETQDRSLGQEDPLEKGMAANSSILACRIPWTEEPGQATVQGVAEELDTTE